MQRYVSPLQKTKSGPKTKKRTFGQRLGRQVSVGFSIDPYEGAKPVVLIPATDFDGEILIENIELAMKSAREEFQGLILWSDGSKQDQSQTGAAVAWKREREND